MVNELRVLLYARAEAAVSWLQGRRLCGQQTQLTSACWMPKTAAWPFLPPAASSAPEVSMLQQEQSTA